MDFLSKKNPHPFDKSIEFKEKGHIYTIDGDSNFMSVTTWNHSHFPKFDSDKIIRFMMKKEYKPGDEYYGMSAKEIKEKWRKAGESSSKLGTKLHFDIECYYNNMPRENETDEYGYFLKFVEDHKELEAYRTEWMIWDKELRLAGSIDMIFKNKDGTYSIYDWKRSKEILIRSKYGNFAETECVNHLPDSNYWHYSLQLHTYKFILEKNYGITVKDLYLIRLHPNNVTKSYQKIKTADLEDEVRDLLSMRLKSLKDKT